MSAWWSTARSTVTANQWEARGWLAFGLFGVVYAPLRSSLAVIFFISCYANRKASLAEAESAKMAMKEEEAEEAKDPGGACR